MSKQRAWVLGAVLSGLLIIALGWFVGISPKLDEAAAADAQLIDVENQNAAQQARLDALQVQFANIDGLRSELMDLQEQISPGTDLSEFVEYAEDLADEADVTIAQYAADAPVSAVSPEAPVAAVPADGAVSPETAQDQAATTESVTPTVDSDAAAGSAGLYAIPVTFNLLGTDDQVFDVVRQLQAGKQIFLVTGLTFGGDDARVLKGYVFVKKALSDPSTDVPAVGTQTAVTSAN